MGIRELLLLIACLALLLGGLPPLTSMTTTTTFVAAMSIANQDLERYFRVANATHTFATMTEERIAMDVYNYAFLNWSYMEGNDEVKSNYKEEQARYGEGWIKSVKGLLVHITNEEDFGDDYACTPKLLGTGGNPIPARGITWIALVRRGRCTFEEKVKNVHALNAAGVIIYNDKQVMQLEKMQIKGKSRNITAVITYQKIGIELANIVDKNHEVIIAIIEGRNGMRPISTLNRTSVLFVSISFIVLMIISLVWLIFYYIQRFRYLQAKDQQSRNLCSVTKKAIMKIPTKTGKMTDEKDIDSDCCAICIEAYKPSDIIRILPCKHEFHKTCIDPWLIEHRTCPMCKLDVLKFYGYVVGDQLQTHPTPTAATTPSPQHQLVPVNYIYQNRLIPQQQQQQQQQQFQQLQQQQPLSQQLQQQQLGVDNAATIVGNNVGVGGAAAAVAPIDVPVIVVAVPAMLEQQQQQQQQQQQSSAASGSPSIFSNTQISCHSAQQQQHAADCPTLRRNSAPAAVLLQQQQQQQASHVSTASRQFLGSEESILEYEPDRSAATGINPTIGGASIIAQTAGNMGNPTRAGALADLIRSRDFVIDFPRVFVLESGSVVGARESLFPERLPERSQSSMSMRHGQNWMTTMSNKLEQQHGLRRVRKDDMRENLLDVRESTRQHRSHSTDGRFASGFFGLGKDFKREERDEQCEQQEQHIPVRTDSNDDSTPTPNTLQQLTDASYAQSSQRQREGFDFESTRRRFMRRDSDTSLRALSRRSGSQLRRSSRSAVRSIVTQSSNDSTTSAPGRDLNITIQINGEGIDLE